MVFKVVTRQLLTCAAVACGVQACPLSVLTNTSAAACLIMLCSAGATVKRSPLHYCREMLGQHGMPHTLNPPPMFARGGPRGGTTSHGALVALVNEASVWGHLFAGMGAVMVW